MSYFSHFTMVTIFDPFACLYCVSYFIILSQLIKTPAEQQVFISLYSFYFVIKFVKCNFCFFCGRVYGGKSQSYEKTNSLQTRIMVLSQQEWYSCLCRFSLLYPPSTTIPHLSHFILVSLVTSNYNSYPTAYEDKEQARSFLFLLTP